MPSLKKITPDFLPELIDGILRRLDPQMPPARWRQAFTCAASTDEGYAGYALTDGPKIVGLQGMIFSRRTIEGQPARFCNLHCWYVEPEHRLKSLLLMKPVLDLKEHTITDFTASARVLEISKRLGFSFLDRTALVLWPRSMARSSGSAELCELNGPNDPRAAEISEADRHILADHQDVGCGHLLVRDGRSYCYVVYSRIDKTWLPYCYAHYVSDKALWVSHDAAIRSHLLHQTGARYVALDGRSMPEASLPRSYRVRTKEALFRSSGVEAAQVDSLYSEMVYFKLSPVMTMKQRLARTARYCLPAPLVRLVGAAP